MSNPARIRPLEEKLAEERGTKVARHPSKKVLQLSEELGSATAAASYILELVRPLAGLAQHNNLDMLSYLLEMAALEAAEVAMMKPEAETRGRIPPSRDGG